MFRLSALATLLSQNKLCFLVILRLGGHWSWSGCFGEQIVLLLLLSLPPRPSSVYPSHYTDCAATCGFEDNTKVPSNKMRLE